MWRGFDGVGGPSLGVRGAAARSFALASSRFRGEFGVAAATAGTVDVAAGGAAVPGEMGSSRGSGAGARVACD